MKTARQLAALGCLAALGLGALASCVGPGLEPPRATASGVPASPDARSAADSGKTVSKPESGGATAQASQVPGQAPSQGTPTAATVPAAGAASTTPATSTTPGASGAAGSLAPATGAAAMAPAGATPNDTSDMDNDAGVAP